jgi:hypothetical protein
VTGGNKKRRSLQTWLVMDIPLRYPTYWKEYFERMGEMSVQRKKLRTTFRITKES